jgi:hypothetical protein
VPHSIHTADVERWTQSRKVADQVHTSTCSSRAPENSYEDGEIRKLTEDDQGIRSRWNSYSRPTRSADVQEDDIVDNRDITEPDQSNNYKSKASQIFTLGRPLVVNNRSYDDVRTDTYPMCILLRIAVRIQYLNYYI